MPDINQVGPNTPPLHPSGKQEVKKPDDAFKQQMREDYKVTETDSETKGKQKQKQSEEEEETVTQSVDPEPPTGTFSLNPSQRAPSPFDIQESNRTSPLSSASTNPNAPNLGNLFTPTAPLEEDVEEEEISFNTTMEPSTSEGSDNSYTPNYNTPTPQTTNPIEQANPVENQNPVDQNNQETKQVTPATALDKKEVKPAEKLSEKGAEVKKLEESAPQIPEVQQSEPSPDAINKLLETATPKEEEVAGTKSGSETKKVTEVKGLSHTTGTPQASKEEEELAALLTPPAAIAPTEISTGKPPALTPTPYATLSHQVMEIFEKMVGVMTVMHLSGQTETTLQLNADKYAGSKFFGTKVTIVQDKNAPGSFNIKLEGTPEAKAVFDDNAQDLMAAFLHVKYNFRIQRLEISLLREERPDIVHRKENASGEKDGQPQ